MNWGGWFYHRCWMVVLLGVGWWSTFSVEPVIGAEVFMGITKSESEKIPFGILGFEVQESLRLEGTTARGILEADLRRSHFFRVIDLPGMRFQGEQNRAHEDLVREIRGVGADAFVWARLGLNGEDVVLEAHVYDAFKGKVVLSKRYSGQRKFFRAVVHRLSDDIVYHYTGEKGFAQTTIAYVSNLSGVKEVFLIDYDGYNPRRITGDQSIVLSPRWSPDGKWITYTSFRDGNPDLFVIDLVTSRRWKMAGFPGLNISPAWNPSGSFLAFASSKDGNTELYLLNREGKNLKRITFNSSTDLSPTWSPSGNAMVFTSDRGGSPQLYLMNADGSNVHRLTFTGSYNSSPSWSPSGEWIAYTCRVDRFFHICLISPDGLKEVQITEGAWDDENPSWAPDGRHLVFGSNREGPFNLYFMGAKGTDLERLTFNGADNMNPAWSPR
ncbi:MAG TPA: Tol-Pal system beta propeller repeat protein TolB [Nitrospiria bacterium]